MCKEIEYLRVVNDYLQVLATQVQPRLQELMDLRRDVKEQVSQAAAQLIYDCRDLFTRVTESILKPRSKLARIVVTNRARREILKIHTKLEAELQRLEDRLDRLLKWRMP